MCRFKKEIALKRKAKIEKKKGLKEMHEKETQEKEKGEKEKLEKEKEEKISDARDVEIDNNTTTDSEEKVDFPTKSPTSSSDSSLTLVTVTYCLVAFLN